MSVKAMRRALVLAVSLCAVAFAGPVGAQGEEGRGIDPNQGESLVEVNLPSKDAAIRLQLDAESYGIDFNDHYLRDNQDGSVTVTVFAADYQLAALDLAGFDLGETIEGPSTWRARVATREAEAKREDRAKAAALDPLVTPQSHTDEIVVLRVDYFENYAGRFLSVEAKDRLGGAMPTGSIYVGPDLSLSYNKGEGTPIDSPPRPMNVNIDPDTTPDTYVEHRELVRITQPAAPTRIRIGSSTGESIEADVDVWLGGGLPPMKERFLKDFTTRYLDPTEVYARIGELAAEFPNISELVPLPNKDERLPAAGAGDDGRHDAAGLHAADGRAGRGGRAHVTCVGPRGRQRPHGPVPESGRRILGAEREHGRQRPRSRSRHRWHRRVVEHGGTGRGSDQRESGRFREARGAHLPR
jgi:hypothetical protein